MCTPNENIAITTELRGNSLQAAKHEETEHVTENLYLERLKSQILHIVYCQPISANRQLNIALLLPDDIQ